LLKHKSKFLLKIIVHLRAFQHIQVMNIQMTTEKNKQIQKKSWPHFLYLYLIKKFSNTVCAIWTLLAVLMVLFSIHILKCVAGSFAPQSL